MAMLGREGERMSKRRLSGKVAVVTGASSGVGRAVARAFADEGADVALIARSAEALEDAAVEVRERGGRALVFPIDVSVPRAVDDAADQVARDARARRFSSRLWARTHKGWLALAAASRSRARSRGGPCGGPCRREARCGMGFG